MCQPSKGGVAACFSDSYFQAGVSGLCNKPKSSSPAAIPPERWSAQVPWGRSFLFLLGFGFFLSSEGDACHNFKNCLKVEQYKN